MCGIAGFCNISSSSFKIDKNLLQRLSQTIVHRGPDGEGTWFSEKYEIAFVHRRLSIIDLSSAGSQPMTDHDNTIVVIFNGEMYNYQDLKKELKALGFQFKNNTDTEVILYAYKAWGIDCLKRFDGMFAIALFDKIKNKLFLIRDRIGIKPLYFSLQGGILSFASEIKALWQMPWISKHINVGALSHYLTYLATPAPSTLYKNIYKLPAGFYACLDAQKNLTFNQWYDVTESKKITDLSETEYLDQLYELIQKAVQKRCISDVPVGIFLSGGLDSSIVTALMSRQQKEIKTFNVIFSDGPELAESKWAHKVAQQFNTHHHELLITERQAYDSFEDIIQHQDEPLADCVCVPLFAVSHFAKKEGISVVQVGEGADELFCGYPLYGQYLKWNNSWSLTQRIIPSMLRKGLFYAAKPIYDIYAHRLGLLDSWAKGKQFFNGSVHVFSRLAKEKLLQADSFETDPMIEKIIPGMRNFHDDFFTYYRNKWFSTTQSADLFSLMTYLELQYRLPELLLTRTDKMSMSASIESRVPFLDYQLVEFALQMPVSLKYKNGKTKYCLKKIAERLLPKDVIYRKKMGFSAPIVRWFKKGKYFKESLQEQLSQNGNWSDYIDKKSITHMLKMHEQQKENYAYHLWAVYNLIPFLK